jgi:hypothetical protein
MRWDVVGMLSINVRPCSGGTSMEQLLVMATL